LLFNNVTVNIYHDFGLNVLICMVTSIRISCNFCILLY